MKKAVVFLIIAVFFMMAGCVTTNHALPFAGHTDCKPVKRMTQQQWRQSILGNNLYTRQHGKMVKNNHTVRMQKARDKQYQER